MVITTIASWINVTFDQKHVIKSQFWFVTFTQVCDSDTMLDPASSVEMVKVLEEDPMVGGVGGDVQVCNTIQFKILLS